LRVSWLVLDYNVYHRFLRVSVIIRTYVCFREAAKNKDRVRKKGSPEPPQAVGLKCSAHDHGPNIAQIPFLAPQGVFLVTYGTRELNWLAPFLHLVCKQIGCCHVS